MLKHFAAIGLLMYFFASFVSASALDGLGIKPVVSLGFDGVDVSSSFGGDMAACQIVRPYPGGLAGSMRLRKGATIVYFLNKTMSQGCDEIDTLVSQWMGEPAEIHVLDLSGQMMRVPLAHDRLEFAKKRLDRAERRLVSHDERYSRGDPDGDESFDEYSPQNLNQVSPYPAIPEGLLKLFGRARLNRSYVLAFDAVNPFYLCADFDGDGKRDYAVNVRSRNENRRFVSDIVILRGNGDVSWLKQDVRRPGYPGPAWRVLYKDEKGKIRDNGESPVPRLVGDGFIIEKPASSSALVYWDGRRFNLYWQSD